MEILYSLDWKCIPSKEVFYFLSVTLDIASAQDLFYVDFLVWVSLSHTGSKNIEL